MFEDMEKLAQILRTKREKRGAIDFDFKEAKVLVNEEGKPHLTWAAPTTGLNGGKFKASELRYKIVRYPGADVVAEACTETQFTDNNVPGTMKSAYYEVTA